LAVTTAEARQGVRSLRTIFCSLHTLLTRTYPIEEINEAYAALERGEVARSIVTF